MSNDADSVVAGFDALHTVLFLSPFVIGLRLPVLAGESFSFDLRDRPETNRLVSEKLGAMVEGFVGVQKACMTIGADLAADAAAMRFGFDGLTRAAETMIGAGFAPAAVCVRQNAERLMPAPREWDGALAKS